MLEAVLAWRHCTEHAAQCARTRSWGTFCPDVEEDPIFVTSSRVARVPNVSCRVCNINTHYASDTYQESDITDQYNEGWNNLVELHRNTEAAREDVRVVEAEIARLEEDGEEDSAEYADAEDEREAALAGLHTQANALVEQERANNQLREDLETLQDAKVRVIAMADQSINFFFGNQHFDDQGEEMVEGKRCPHHFPRYSRTHFAYSILPSDQAQRLRR